MNVLLLRDAQDLGRAIPGSHGLTFFRCPAIAIQPLPVHLRSLEYDVLIVSSQHALRSLRQKLKVKWVVAIGAQTESSLKKYRRYLNYQRLIVLKKSTSEGIVEFFKRAADRAPQRILYLRSSRGDPQTIRSLRSLGFRVQVRHSYQTQLLKLKRPLDKFLSRKIDAVFLTSPSIVKALKNSFTRRELEAWNSRWISIGPTTQAAAKKYLGLKGLEMSEDTSMAAMIKAFRKRRSARN